MGEFLDDTAVHTWWNNDDLLGDGVVTKRLDRASLHQETGLMRRARAIAATRATR